MAAAHPLESPGLEGSNAQKCSALLGSLQLDAVGAAKAELVLTLARRLDAGAGMSTAAVARELRAALDDLLAQSPREVDFVDRLVAKRMERQLAARETFDDDGDGDARP